MDPLFGTVEINIVCLFLYTAYCELWTYVIFTLVLVTISITTTISTEFLLLNVWIRICLRTCPKLQIFTRLDSIVIIWAIKCCDFVYQFSYLKIHVAV